MLRDAWNYYIKPYLFYIFVLGIVCSGTVVLIEKGVANHKLRKRACIAACKYNRNLKYVDYFEHDTPYLICICSAKNNFALELHATIIDNEGYQ